jgi:undecaprenyl-diphosphatase
MSDGGEHGRSSAEIERSPADVLRLVVALGLLVVVFLLDWLFGESIVSFSTQLLDGLQHLPDALLSTLLALTRAFVAAALLVAVIQGVRHKEWRALLTVGAAAVAAATFELIGGFIEENSEAVAGTADLFGRLGDAEFPTATGLAVAAAVVSASAPWLSRGTRRGAWALLVALAFCHFVTAPLSFDVVVSLLWGWAAGAAALVAMGAPLRRPAPAAVEAGLRGIGVEVEDLHPASVDARGSTPYFGTTRSGSLFVKVLGRDERSADLLFRMYRSLRRKHLGDERPFSSLRRAVEHEALVALAARDVGIRTPRFAGFASAEPGGFVLAYEGLDGTSLDGVAVDDFTDELLAGVWEQLALCRTHRIAHRDLRLANVFRDADGQAWLIDFGFSELAASDLLLATDVAEALASQSLQIGPDRAVAAARAAVGDEAVASAAARLQPSTLSGATRTALKEQPELLGHLRALVQAPPPASSEG